MKKILAVLAALCLMALPVASLAEATAAEVSSTTQLQYAVGNIELSVNGVDLDFTGLEIDGLLTVDPDGSISESVQYFVGEQMALGGVLLVNSEVMTIALRGVDGVFLTPAVSMNMNELMELYSGQAGGADIEAMINQYLGKAMGVMGIVMSRLNEIEPETSVWTDYRFCDNVVSDVAVNIYTLDSDTLNDIAADVMTALEVSSPISFDGVTLKVVGGATEEGRTVFSVILSNTEQFYSVDVQVFSAEGGQTCYVCAYSGDTPIADALAVYSIIENVFSANLAVNVPDASLTLGLTVTAGEDQSLNGQFQCNLVSKENTLSFLSDLYLKVIQGEGLVEVADLSSLETVDLMALTQDEDASNAVAQQWAPSLMESITLLRQVPALNLLIQAYLPAETTTAE